MDKLLSIKYWYLIPLTYIGIFWNQYFGSEIVVYGIFLFGLILSVKSLSEGTLYFIIVLLLFDDFPFQAKENQIFNSIYTATIFGQTISKLLSLWLFGLIVLKSFQIKKIIIGNLFSKIFLSLMIISLIVGISSLNYKYAGSFINDFRFFFNYIVGFGIVVYLLAEKDYFKAIFPLMTLIFLSKIIVLTGTTIILSNFGSILTIKAGTGSYLIIFVVCYLLYLLTERRYILYTSIGLFLTLGFLVLSASRGRIVITGLVIVLYILTIRKTKYIPIIIAFTGIAIVGIFFINPSLIDYLMWKITSFTPQKGSGQSSYVRFVEISNILHQNFTSVKSFFFGNGLGGFWDSKYLEYPFDLKNTSSYPEEWILRDRYFKPHGIVQFLLLKIGFIGTLSFYGSILYLYIKNFTKYKTNNLINKESAAYVTIILVGLLPFYLIAFSAKLQLLGGVMVGICYCYTKALKIE